MSLLGRQFGNVRRATDAAEALCLIEQPEFAGKLGLVISGTHCRESAGRPSWPNCTRGCRLCRCWCWARPTPDPPITPMTGGILPRPFVAENAGRYPPNAREQQKNAVA